MRGYDLYFTAVFKIFLICDKCVLFIKYLSCIVICKICLHHGCSGVLLVVEVKYGLCLYLCILVRMKNQWVCYFHFKILEVVHVSMSLQIPPCSTLLCCILKLASHNLLIICYCQMQ
jgi:hypothetical protein